MQKIAITILPTVKYLLTDMPKAKIFLEVRLIGTNHSSFTMTFFSQSNGKHTLKQIILACIKNCCTKNQRFCARKFGVVLEKITLKS